MKLKYYLRGLGIGIICTAIIMGIALSGNKKEMMTDTEIIERARLLGMVMPEDVEEPSEAEEGQESPDDNLAKPQEVQGGESVSEIEKNKTDSKKDEGKKENSRKENPSDKPEQTNDNAAAGNAQQGTSPEMIQIEIAAGDFSDAVSQKLFRAGLVSDAEAFNKYLTQKGADQTLRIGVYEIPKGATQDEIIEILTKKE